MDEGWMDKIGRSVSKHYVPPFHITQVRHQGLFYSTIHRVFLPSEHLRKWLHSGFCFKKILIMERPIIPKKALWKKNVGRLKSYSPIKILCKLSFQNKGNEIYVCFLLNIIFFLVWAVLDHPQLISFWNFKVLLLPCFHRNFRKVACIVNTDNVHPRR